MLFNKHTGKGILTLPIAIFPSLILGCIGGYVAYLLKIEVTDLMVHLFFAFSFCISGVLNKYLTRNYFIAKNEEPVFYELEGTFMYVGVSSWTTLFFFIACVNLFIAVLLIFNIEL